MITGIVFIILFTAAFGRLFCGWVCPQTIFMEMLFRKIEFWIEGDAPTQKLLNRSPWTWSKIIKKVSKHLVFFLLAIIISDFFLAYIIGIKELQLIVSEPASQHIGGLLSIMILPPFFMVYTLFSESRFAP